jgi:Xaa-Pro aminopeptidase
MKTEFKAEFFEKNRKRLRELQNYQAPIVITANGQLQRSGDSTYPFQQDANFWYLTGINDPDMLLVIDTNEEYVILPKRSGYQDVFDGEIDTKSLSQKSGISLVHEYDAGWEKLNETLREAKSAATIPAPPVYVDLYGMYTNPSRRVLTEKLKAANEKLEIVDISGSLVQLREIKQPVELTAIMCAIEITGRGLEQIMKPELLKKYVYEYEVEADLTRAFRRSGSGHAFEPIIAGGQRACTLHNTGMNGKISANELLLFDVGATYECYAADISRTIAISKPTERQQAVYDAVKEVQAFAFSILKPGVLLKEYETQIEHKVGEKLLALGLIKTIDTVSVRKYYPHSASHHLGLDVHDVGDRDKPLAPNMVITVEPGIYIPEEGIGVRIEDDVVITESGIDILSKSLPASLN